MGDDKTLLLAKKLYERFLARLDKKAGFLGNERFPHRTWEELPVLWEDHFIAWAEEELEKRDGMATARL